MNKKLLRIAAVVCLMISVLFLEQTSVYADEVKPVHEYNFDNDGNRIDSGNGDICTIVKNLYQDDIGHCDGKARGANQDKYVTGYNGTGKARYFDGKTDNIFFSEPTIPYGAKSIRFKFRKDASTLSNTKFESIMSTMQEISYLPYSRGFIIGIGSESRENTIPGSIYILARKDNTTVYEIQTPRSVCDGQWHDVLFTWDGTTDSNSVRLYLDDMTTPIAQSTATTTEFTLMGDNLKIGISTADGYPENRHWLNGYLDNVQFYDSAITPSSTTPGNPSTPSQDIGNRVLLVITMVTGEQKEYEMTADEINDFITWYNSKAVSSPTYMIDKDYNHASFISRKDYIAYEQISNFEVNEYE